MRFISLLAAGIVAIMPASAERTLEGVASGDYSIERNHAFLTWAVRHGGLSDYTVHFTEFSGALKFNAEDPEASTISFTINPRFLETNYPDPEKKKEWETELSFDERFFNAETYPFISFDSTEVDMTGEFEGTVTGDLTFLGITKSVTLDVSYNGLQNVPWFGERDIIGFNATTTLKRSDFGQTSLAQIISDDVVIEFSGEFLQDQ